MGIPERLVEIREKHGYTRKKLAEELGKPYATITKYETGEREAGHEYLIEIAKKFHVTTDYLLGLENLEDPTSEQEKSPTSAEAEAGELQMQEVIDAFVQAGFIQRGRDLTDADLRFLRLIGDMVSGWFDSEKNSV